MPFQSADHCQGQLQTPQSLSICIYRTAWHHVPGYSKSSVTAIRTSKHTTLCIFLWEEFHINSSPVSLLYLSSVNCQNESELTGYGPLLHNVSHNSSPSRSIMGHDITVQEPECDVIGGGTQHICSIQITNFCTNMILCQASQSMLGIKPRNFTAEE